MKKERKNEKEKKHGERKNEDLFRMVEMISINKTGIRPYHKTEALQASYKN